MRNAHRSATGSWLLARTATVVALFVVAMNASAQTASCVVLKTEGQKEEIYTDAQGKQAKRLVAPAKVIPGDEVIWTITATNTCDKPADRIVVNNNVPEHMVYVADSAFGPGTDIAYSLNGRDFAKANELTVREADGKTRPARADEIKSVRWTFAKAFEPKSTGFVRYRAKVK